MLRVKKLSDMLKKALFMMLTLVFLLLETRAEWVPLDNRNTLAKPPDVKLISDDASGTVIRVDLFGFSLGELVTDGRTYQAIDLLTEMATADPGRPEVPYLAEVLAVPDKAAISVEILETGEVQTYENIYLPPARPSWWEGEPVPTFSEDAEAYGSDDVYPKELVTWDPPGVFRDFRIARFSVFPVRYYPARRELQVVSSVTFRITYGKGEVINPKTTPRKAIAPSFGQLYRSFIFNYQQVLDKLYNGKELGHELMLCILPDALDSSFQVYADWRRRSGTDVRVTKFSDIGANATNPDIIKGHIADAYHNWEFPPTYVLIVGDDGVFPKKIVNFGGWSFPNEDYFVEIDGNDFFPEMMIGRFTNEGDYRMQVMINKFLKYEKEPYLGNPHWFKHALCCSNNDYPSQVQTKRFTATLMLHDGGFIAVDTMMSDGGWGVPCTYGVSDIMAALNDGRSFLNYRGDGWYTGWNAYCYDLNTGDVSSLNNGEQLTFVTSIGCGVARFDQGGSNCFGETWVELGTLTSPRGGVCFIGAVSNTHTTYDNKIDKGIYVGMFQEGMDTPGQALLRGKLYMFHVYGTAYYVEYHYKVFCILGDPAIHIWKDVPEAVNVDYQDSVLVGNNHLEFTVTFASSGEPVANAVLCLTKPIVLAGNNLFITAVSDSTGKAVVDLVSETAETLSVTVRGGNVIPFLGSLEVIQPDQLVEPEENPPIVDLDGNLDGKMNPNETCAITFTLKNWGYQPANNVQATLIADDPNFIQVITVDPVGFGNLVPGASFTGDPYQFFVKPNCQVGQIITLKLHVTSSSCSWDYLIHAEVRGCQLAFRQYLVKDEGGSNPDYRMDPGETVLLVVSVENTGDDIAPDVMGILSTGDPYITVDDDYGFFASIDTTMTAINADNCFVVSVSSSCPTGHWVTFTLTLSTQNGYYAYQTSYDVIVPVSLPIPQDYTGPDAYGYYAYANTDTFYDETPAYDWFEIEATGTKIDVPYGDYTETVSLPFTFTHYGNDYNQTRISTDGWLALSSGSQVAPENATLPHYDDITSMVGVFWDDLYEEVMEEGEIFYYNDAVNHRFIVEWDSISHNDTNNEPLREVFQAILYDPAYYVTMTGDGEIVFQYKKVTQNNSMTVGIEDDTQQIGLQYVFNDNYDLTASEVVNGTAIKFTTDPPYIALITGKEENPEAGSAVSRAGVVLEQNQPNPFSGQTRIGYVLPEAGTVELTIYNGRGEKVCTLESGRKAAGRHTTSWNGRNDRGNLVCPGLYFYRLLVGGCTETRKMFMVK
jgi:hypothetical protein